MNRRAFLSAAPAAALAGPAAAETETPVAALFREWRDYSDWLNGPATRGMDDNDFTALCCRLYDMGDQIGRTPATDAKDVLLKLVALSGYGEMGVPGIFDAPVLWAEARALVA